MLTSYQKGKNAESYVIAKISRDLRCHYIIRSYASHTPIDIIASNSREIYAIQVKQGGYINKEDRDLLIEWSKAFNAKPIAAIKKRKRWVLIDLPVREV